MNFLFYTVKLVQLWKLSGPIVERKDTHTIFQKKGKKMFKRGKYLKTWAKMCKI